MTVQKKNLILIFDTNIFLSGVDFNLIKGIIFTTPEIIGEIEVEKYSSQNRTIIVRVDTAIQQGKLIVRSPEISFIRKALDTARITGDLNALSKGDYSIIALALELSQAGESRVTVYSNDYSVQNLCNELKLEYSPLFREPIKRKTIFEVYCPNCHEIYDSSYLNLVCEKCGTNLKRKPKKKSHY
jgi:UPF0271 protein